MISKLKTRSPQALFEASDVGALKLANCIVMAPLTRNRAGPGLVPGPFAVEYYAQRASAGLIVAEATQISAQAQGYAGTPGCYTDEQVEGWKKVTAAVHAKGGTIVVQLWHTGRVSHTSFQKDGQAPVGPSAIQANTKTFLAGQGFVDVSMPRALHLDEVPGIIDDFRNASTRAIEAGFDGVELHGAHGYLLDAFLRDGTNHRTDSYGGSIENRTRLLLEVTDACAEAIGPDRLACGFPRFPPPAIRMTAIRKLCSLMLSRGLACSAWPICMWSKARPAVPGKALPSTMLHCAPASMESGWSITAMTARWRSMPSQADAPI